MEMAKAREWKRTASKRKRKREASISRAFGEDESRRSAPPTPENAARIVDAMKGRGGIVPRDPFGLGESSAGRPVGESAQQAAR
ncbi:hypothetical protein COCNU_04G013390 [Cocos nucifera]|uniref:Uncharacterized protein n=1 Tax=Cocos nucifera TaxID=13894 RepID=A0A8K0N0S6_COCNU|nr:hypothetical protein COCNU_04G013390 [Cocos nucifera]